MATLFLSSNHGTIVNLISMGAAPGEEFVAPYRVGALAIYCLFYLLLMAIGAGLAIPGGLFMPSMIVSSRLYSVMTEADHLQGMPHMMKPNDMPLCHKNPPN